jgi:hypothetical protein
MSKRELRRKLSAIREAGFFGQREREKEERRERVAAELEAMEERMKYWCDLCDAPQHDGPHTPEGEERAQAEYAYIEDLIRERRGGRGIT